MMHASLQQRRSQRLRFARPMLEPLENRLVPTAGMLDTTFDQDGLVTTAIGTSDDEIHSLATQADGK